MGRRPSSGIHSSHAIIVQQASEDGFHGGTAPFFHPLPLRAIQAGLHPLVVVAEGGNCQLLVSTLAAASRFYWAGATITGFGVIIIDGVAILHSESYTRQHLALCTAIGILRGLISKKPSIGFVHPADGNIAQEAFLFQAGIILPRTEPAVGWAPPANTACRGSPCSWRL